MPKRIDKFMLKPVDHIVYLDVFYNRIITYLAEHHQCSVSETLKNIIINWVNEHHEFLKKDHGINFRELMENIQKEKLMWKRLMGKKTKRIDRYRVIQETIQKLVKFSELFNEIEFDILAEQLNVDKKILREIVIDHKTKLEELGLKLRFRDNLIVKYKS